MNMNAQGARIVNLVLGIWLFISAFVWPHSTAQMTNTWILGVLTVISGLGWLAFLWPPLANALWPRVLLPLDVGEMALVLWLLIAGVNVERWHEQAGRSSPSDSASARL